MTRAASIPGRAGRIGAPSRALSSGDQPAPWPDLYGGPGGSIALPSRETPSSPPTGPYADTDRSGLGPNPDLTAWSGPSFDVYGRANATPHAIFALHYVRRFVSTTAAALARYAPPLQGRTDWTMNTVAAQGAPASPIPAYRRFVVESFVEPWGWGRIWNDYLAPPKIQKGVITRRLLSQEQLPRMGDPYQPRVTQLALTPNAQTPVPAMLTPAQPIGNTGINPYAAGPTVSGAMHGA